MTARIGGRGRRSRLAVALALAASAAAPVSAGADHVPSGSYRNPLAITIPGSSVAAETFADPAVIRGRDGFYYAYGTSDPLTGGDRDEAGALRSRRIPIARSSDLVHWTYVGDAFSSVPSWLAPTAGIWAPEVRYLGGRYVLYFTATDTADAISGEAGCDADSAIGVATSPSPTGPWTATDTPVVAPRRAGPGCEFYWTFDAAVAAVPGGKHVLYYGSYHGGIEARALSPDGLSTDPTATRIAVADRYEGSYVVRRRGYFWYFGSATDCCAGPLTGYSVFAGRSRSPYGPFVDREGVPLTASRVGGTPVISMNGNRWVGTGHNSVIRDAAGQDWFVYHAVDRAAPYLSAPNTQRINRRPMLMDRLTWKGGWPSVRAGRWASDTPQPAPVTAAGGSASRAPARLPDDAPGRYRKGPSDEFDRGRPESAWRWVRGPADVPMARPGQLTLRTAAGDLTRESNSAPLLVRRAPRGDFMVETKFTFDLPETGIFEDFPQAGLALYADDDRFLKLVHVGIFQTRQTEWAKEVARPAIPEGPRYGNTVIGPPARPFTPGAATWLRVVKRTDRRSGEQRYTAYSSIDGRRWVRGGTWVHRLKQIQIALLAMGGEGHSADFDYVRVFRLANRRGRERAATAPVAAAPSAAPQSALGLIPPSTASRQAYSRRFPAGG